jgi:FKBP-type peptidyl-prolyl cis-trans isomerase
MNVKQKNIFLFVMAMTMAFAITSCSKYKGYKQDESGYYYREHLVNPDSLQPKEGDAVIMEVTMRAGDSVFFQNTIPYLLNEEQSLFKGDLYYAVKRMHLGDSISFLFHADSLLHYYFHDQLVFDVEMIQVDIKLQEMYMTKEQMEEQEAMMKAEIENRRVQEAEELAAYIAEHKVKVEPTSSGIYFIETKKGTGKKAATGNQVTVHYKGTFVNGTVFDTSIDRGEPLVFRLGIDSFIPGFAEGVSMMKEGGKATLLLPSHLAYGEQGNRGIPPHTPLVFEVELISVSE